MTLLPGQLLRLKPGEELILPAGVEVATTGDLVILTDPAGTTFPVDVPPGATIAYDAGDRTPAAMPALTPSAGGGMPASETFERFVLGAGAVGVTLLLLDDSDSSAAPASAPVFASPATFTVDENTTAVGTVQAMDAGSPVMTYSISGGADATRFAIDPNTGSLSFLAAPDFESPTAAGADNVYRLEVTASNGQNTAVQTLTVTVSDLDDTPPVANDTRLELDENSANGTIVGTVTAEDADDVLSYAITGGDPGGVFAIDPDSGAITVANSAALDFETTSSFDLSVQIRNAAGLSDSATVRIDLGNVNEAPVLQAPSAVLIVEGPEQDSFPEYEQLLQASDPENDALTYALEDAETGSFSFQGQAFDQRLIGQYGSVFFDGDTGQVVYAVDNQAVNALGADAQETFRFSVTDADGLSDSQDLAVLISAANDRPLTAADRLSAVENIPITYAASLLLANDGDAEAQALFIDSVSDGAGGTVTLNPDGSVSFAPTPDFAGEASFTYIASDGQSTNSLSAPTTVIIDVAGVDAAAVIGMPSNASVTEDVNVDSSGNLVASGSIPISDDDGATQARFQTSVTPVGTPLGGLSLSADGSYTYLVSNAAAQFLGADATATDTFTVTAVDGTTARVMFTVRGADDAPVAVDDSRTVREDSGANAINVLANDTDFDGGPRLIQSVVQPANGSVAITGGGTGLSYTPDANFNGQDSFTYTLNGGSQATVSITVNAVNEPPGPVDDAPVAVDDAATVDEDSGATALNVLANDTDTDGGPRLIQSVIQPDNGSVSISGNGTGLSYTPDVNFNGADSFTYTLNGGSQATVSVTVNAVTDAAIIGTPSNASVTEDLDVDGSENLVASGSIPISDADGAAQAMFQTSVSAVGTPLGSLSLNANGSYTYTVSNAATQHLGVGANATATDTFTVTSVDGTTANVTFTITGVNDAPEVDTTRDDLAYTENDPATAIDPDLIITDVDSPTLASATVRLGSDYISGEDLLAFNDTDNITGSFNTTDGTLTLIGVASIADYEAALRSVTYQNTSDDPTDRRRANLTVNDGLTDSDRASRFIEITRVNDAPTAIALNNLEIDENSAAGTVVGTLSTTDVDAGDTFTYTLLDDASGRFQIVGNQVQATGTGLDFETNEQHEIEVQVTDSGNATFTRTFQITVNDVNENLAPVVSDVVLGPSITYTADDADPLSLRIRNNDTNAITPQTATGTPPDFTYTPDSLPTTELAGVLEVVDAGGLTAAIANVYVGTGADNTFSALNNPAFNAALPAALYGFLENDRLTGGDQDDYIDAGSDGGAAADILVGGLGDDTFSGVGSNDNIDGGEGNDTVVVTTSQQTYFPSTLSGVENVVAAPGSANISIDLGLQNEDFTVLGNAGNNTLTSSNGNDVIRGNEGNDVLRIIGGRDTLFGGSGSDTLVFLGTADYDNSLIDGGEDTDTLRIERSNFSYRPPNENLTGVELVTVLDGRTNINLDFSLQTEALDITGGQNTDVLIGGSNNDTIRGGSGDDMLAGGLGGDTLTGGTGTNRFNILNTSESAFTSNTAPGNAADTVIAFLATDTIDFGDVIGTAGSYSETTDAVADFAAAVAAANAAFVDAGVLYHFAFDATNGYLFYNRNGGASLTSGDDVVVLPGITAANFSQVNIFGTAPPNTVAPVFQSPTTFDLNEGLTSVGTVNATDADGPMVSYAITSGTDAALFDINSSTGALEFIDAPDFEMPVGGDNTYNLTVTASDGTNSTPQPITVTVNNIDDNNPVANDDSGSTGENTTLNVAANGVLANDTDADGTLTPLTITAVNGNAANVGQQITLASGATLMLSDTGAYTYNPGMVFDYLAQGTSTTDTFTYTLSDGSGPTDDATVTVTITGSNDNPVVSLLTPQATVTQTDDLAILATGIVELESTLEVSGLPFTAITDLNLDLDLLHTDIRDLVITLIAPDGTSALLFDRLDSLTPQPNDNLDVLLDDEAGIPIHSIPGSPITTPGNYTPLNPLSVFDGRDPNGTWTLRIEDTEPPRFSRRLVVVSHAARARLGICE
ncbi:Ig-like domain-containing protein [Panacagrimonas sp.]|uniref:Ig-like domain-containing protein n=1 Tax=Panacagrimonas sp. TaxID=2480088 RepID=UPI003B52866B